MFVKVTEVKVLHALMVDNILLIYKYKFIQMKISLKEITVTSQCYSTESKHFLRKRIKC